jgi:hypothetical protein
MKISMVSTRVVLVLVAAAAFLSAGGAAALCHKYERSTAGDGHIIQMLDRMAEQQTLASALAKLREGDLKAANDLLTARMGDNANAIYSLVMAASQQYRPLAEALAQTYQTPIPSMAIQAQADLPPSD